MCKRAEKEAEGAIWMAFRRKQASEEVSEMNWVDIKDVLTFIIPPATGALIYILTEPKTADVVICAIVWTFLWWFVLAVGRALERFYP
ncbi:MAG: hypothetical protein DRN68_03570 [Thaumarchaeota archaeon]|nr:MAG: hypothetical protein DRN68_03570 [Nitrososphaerota archaeon]